MVDLSLSPSGEGLRTAMSLCLPLPGSVWTPDRFRDHRAVHGTTELGWRTAGESFRLVAMPMDMSRYAERSRYRLGSAVLISFICLALASVQIGIPVLIVFLVGVAAYIVLTVITYRRLRDANLSSAWLLLMILQFGIGPTWHLSDYVTFNIGGSIVGLVPVILGWTVAGKSNQNIELESA